MENPRAAKRSALIRVDGTRAALGRQDYQWKHEVCTVGKMERVIIGTAEGHKRQSLTKLRNTNRRK